MGERPYLTAALICDRVLQEQDGTLSVIRIVDRVQLRPMTIVAAGQQTPLPAPPIGGAIHLNALVSLKRGKSDGKFTLTIEATSPSDKVSKIYEGPFEMVGGEARGQNVVIKLIVTTEEGGLHWFDVRLDGELISRIPLVIEFLPEQVVSQT